MEITDVERLLDKFENSSIREMKLNLDGSELFLSKNEYTQKTEAEAGSVLSAQKAESPLLPKEAAEAAPVVQAEKAVSGHAIKSPLVGTIYLQPAPDKPAFVKTGDHVKAGQTVCIVEAMKMMTEIKSDVSGTVKEVCVENEDLVECEQTLFLIEED
ncbi:acetyl-CoA carboxylase, biotin carboxyl carrier protein [Lactobacillus delbrueckii subsp. bulgaricus]|nr:acetyl-CoA carboxylase, biotin carboxyl carrier protein [Lactobacillus delbrueckii subsp. bulgaricus]